MQCLGLRYSNIYLSFSCSNTALIELLAMVELCYAPMQSWARVLNTHQECVRFSNSMGKGSEAVCARPGSSWRNLHGSQLAIQALCCKVDIVCRHQSIMHIVWLKIGNLT